MRLTAFKVWTLRTHEFRRNRRIGLIAARTTIFFLSWSSGGRAQESDTAVFKDQATSYSILSEIESADERQAFVSALEATVPAKRHALAQVFIDRYPQSWLLAQASDIAARASIDSGDYRRALEEARLSLRLVPENATLLVLVANVEAKTGLVIRAQASARRALAYLDEFVGPGNISTDQWRAIKPQLKSSAYFALGRALATQKPDQSLDALNRSAAWNPGDQEVLYLRALIELRLGKNDLAARDLASVARHSIPLRSEALRRFRQLSDEDVSKVLGPSIDATLREDVVATNSPEALRAGYAGSAACRTCHLSQYDTWSKTGMARMLRSYKPENIIGDFSPGAEFHDDNNKAAIQMGTGSRPYFDVQTANGQWHRFPVDYTIGSKWQQGYATRLPDGRLQVFPIEYNVLQKAWVNYWKIIDPPGSKRAVVSGFPELSSATNYQENCAVCHTSQLRASSNAEGSLESAGFQEPGVNCEMCHGPSAQHVEQMKGGKHGTKTAFDPPVDFARVDNRTGVTICAQCHKQSALRQIGSQSEMNYSSDGPSFVPISWSRPADVFSRRAFYKDGRFRETTFMVEAFTRSACYRDGNAQCASCHSPHTSDSTANLTSLRFQANPNEMCLRCHDQYRTRVAEHTHHRAESEASQCVACHMPRIMNAVLFQARSHQIEIPTADLTARFGQSESPNACLICHSDKGASWAEQGLLSWRNPESRAANGNN